MNSVNLKSKTTERVHWTVKTSTEVKRNDACNVQSTGTHVCVCFSISCRGKNASQLFPSASLPSTHRVFPWPFRKGTGPWWIDSQFKPSFPDRQAQKVHNFAVFHGASTLWTCTEVPGRSKKQLDLHLNLLCLGSGGVFKRRLGPVPDEVINGENRWRGGGVDGRSSLRSSAQLCGIS